MVKAEIVHLGNFQLKISLLLKNEYENMLQFRKISPSGENWVAPSIFNLPKSPGFFFPLKRLRISDETQCFEQNKPPKRPSKPAQSSVFTAYMSMRTGEY